MLGWLLEDSAYSFPPSTNSVGSCYSLVLTILGSHYLFLRAQTRSYYHEINDESHVTQRLEVGFQGAASDLEDLEDP